MTRVFQRLRTIPFPLLALLILSIVGFSLYAASLGNEFLMDDEEQIVNNRLTESLDQMLRIFKGTSTGEGGSYNSYGVYFRPLMLALFALLRSSFGLTPVPFHVLQLGLHIGAAFFLALFLRQFFRPALALLCAVVFLIHPMNVEAVSYIAALQDPLCAVFAMSALWLVAGCKRLSAGALLGLGTLGLLALFGKETAILYFFAIALYALFFRRENWLRVAFVLAGATLIYFAIRAGFAGLTSIQHDSTQLARAPYSVRLLTLPLILASYLGKFAVPLRLATTQDWIVTSLDPLEFWLPLAFVFGLTVACLAYWRKTRDKVFLFFFIWALAGLGFHSHLLAALDGTVAERWFYMPCMGLIGICAAIGARYRETLVRHRAVAATLVGLLIAGFAARTVLRSLDWSDGYTLYTTDIVHQQDSAHLQNNVGVELFRRGQIQEAKGYFEKSIELNPGWKISWNNLGAVYHRTGNLTKAEECYRNSMKYGPYLLAYRGLAMALAQENRISESQTFITRALLQFPADPELLQLAERLRKH